VGAWTEFSLAVVENALPSDVRAHYQAWVAVHPEKAGRLGELVEETLSLFRQAVASNPGGALDAGESMIPVTGFRHAMNVLVFNLAMESGAELVPEVYQLMMRADVWLRMVQRGQIVPDPQGASDATPSYAFSELERVLL
jgi:hypothetical protein